MMLSDSMVLAVASWLSTYIVHSVLIVLSAWLCDRWLAKAPLFRERMWKASLILPLISTSVVLLFAGQLSVFEWSFVRTDLTHQFEKSGLESAKTQSTSSSLQSISAPAIEAHQDVLPEVQSTNAESINKTVQDSSKNDQLVVREAILPVQLTENDSVWEISVQPMKSHVRQEFDWVQSETDFASYQTSDSLTVESKIDTAFLNDAIVPMLPDRTTSWSRVPQISFLRALVMGFILISSFGIFRMVASVLRVQAIIREGRPSSSTVARSIQRLLDVADQPEMLVRVLISDHAAEPSAVGIMTPTILLPPTLQSQVE